MMLHPESAKSKSTSCHCGWEYDEDKTAIENMKIVSFSLLRLLHLPSPTTIPYFTAHKLFHRMSKTTTRCKFCASPSYLSSIQLPLQAVESARDSFSLSSESSQRRFNLIFFVCARKKLSFDGSKSSRNPLCHPSSQHISHLFYVFFFRRFKMSFHTKATGERI